jgi:hypothetical protein
MRSPSRPVVVLFEVALAIGVGYFVWRALKSGWSDLQSQPLALELRPSAIAVSAGIVLVTYALLVESWRRVLSSWGHSLSWASAARIWTLSNLGRYVPGKIWSVAGLAYLGKRAGVGGFASASAAVLLQIMSLGTGAAAAAAGAPGAASAPLTIAAIVLAATTIAVTTSSRLRNRLGSLVPALAPLREAGPGAGPLLVAATATAIAWLTYGVALFWLARGVLPEPQLGLRLAVGAFAASYLAGLVAVFAPGGVVVREGILFGLLQPSLGAPAALTLALASRLLLTAAELIAAGGAWMVSAAAGKESTS